MAVPTNQYVATDRELSQRLREHVGTLSEKIGPRSVEQYENLNRAALYIEGQLRSIGYKIEEDRYPINDLEVRNIWVQTSEPTADQSILVIGAHYDSVGDNCPGANDNATGVAGNLELARALKSANLKQPIRFVFFVNEEPPYFASNQMGSYVHAKKLSESKVQALGMISLETIGYYSEKKDSQQFPIAALSKIYPTTGNFVAFVGNLSAKDFLQQVLAVFRKVSTVPSEGISAPAMIEGIDWSDHWSFGEFGIPAFMITDTAPFRYPHYHLETDTPDKINFEKFSDLISSLILTFEKGE